MTETTTTEVRDYTIQLSWDNYRDDHSYNRMGEYNFSPKNKGKYEGQEHFASLEEAVKGVEDSYGDKSSNSFVAYWLHETITKTTVEVLDEKRTVTTVVTSVERDAYVHFRSAEDI